MLAVSQNSRVDHKNDVNGVHLQSFLLCYSLRSKESSGRKHRTSQNQRF